MLKENGKKFQNILKNRGIFSICGKQYATNGCFEIQKAQP